MIRLDNTDNGIQYTIVGAFSEPTHINCAWNYDNIYSSKVNSNDDDYDATDADDNGIVDVEIHS